MLPMLTHVVGVESRRDIRFARTPWSLWALARRAGGDPENSERQNAVTAKVGVAARLPSLEGLSDADVNGDTAVVSAFAAERSRDVQAYRANSGIVAQAQACGERMGSAKSG